MWDISHFGVCICMGGGFYFYEVHMLNGVSFLCGEVSGRQEKACVPASTKVSGIGKVMLFSSVCFCE